MAKGNLVVISGFSGVGKGTVVNSLLQRHTGYALSVSATTRDPRPGEQEGVNYFYLSEDQFKEMIREDGLIEHTVYCNHYYGTPRKFVEDNLARGIDIILEIEVEGALNIRKQYPDSPLIFIMPPSAAALRERLLGRGSEDEETVNKRLTRAAAEAQYVEHYDYIFVNENGKADECADRIHELVSGLHAKLSMNRPFVDEVCSQVKSFAK